MKQKAFIVNKADIYKEEIYLKHQSILFEKIDNLFIEAIEPFVDRYLDKITEETHEKIQKYIIKDKAFDDTKIKKGLTKIMSEVKCELHFLSLYKNANLIDEKILKFKDNIYNAFSKAKKAQELMDLSLKNIGTDFNNQVIRKIKEGNEDLDEEICIKFNDNINPFIRKAKKKIRREDEFSRNLSESFYTALIK